MKKIRRLKGTAPFPSTPTQAPGEQAREDTIAKSFPKNSVFMSVSGKEASGL